MAGFTPQELEEMARADAEIDAAFDTQWEGAWEVGTPGGSNLVWVSRLARQHHTTYGKFVAAHSQEEIQDMVEQMREGGEVHVSI